MQVIRKEGIRIMALFGKKQPELPANFLEDDAAEAAGVDHNSVLDYLLQLKTEDYDKLLKLTNIYRDANKQAGELIPQYDPDRADEPVAHQIDVRIENSPATDDEAEDAELDKLMDDAFIEDEPEKGNRKNAKSNK